MNKPRYKKADVESFFIYNKIGTLQDIKVVIGTDIDMTVFRILKSLSYRSSYSHGGRFYTLDKIAKFDKNGLWCHYSVCFSRYGSLLSTLIHFVTNSKSGYFAIDLEGLLRVKVRESLLRLVKKGKIYRKKISGAYLYCASDPLVRKQQLLTRHLSHTEYFSDKVKAAIVIFVSLLNEQQLRLFAGLEALKFGRGGDLRIAELLGLHSQTVARGRRELIESDMLIERTRKSGAGRKPVEKKHRM